jgi:hypothetical protein
VVLCMLETVVCTPAGVLSISEVGGVHTTSAYQR